MARDSQGWWIGREKSRIISASTPAQPNRFRLPVRFFTGHLVRQQHIKFTRMVQMGCVRVCCNLLLSYLHSWFWLIMDGRELYTTCLKSEASRPHRSQKFCSKWYKNYSSIRKCSFRWKWCNILCWQAGEGIYFSKAKRKYSSRNLRHRYCINWCTELLRQAFYHLLRQPTISHATKELGDSQEERQLNR